MVQRDAAPTLVADARNDGRCPFEYGRALAAGIPGSRFLPLESRNLILFGYEHAFRHFMREMHAFLERDTPYTETGSEMPVKASERELATILFTDIVNSTRHAVELGDRAWTELLHEHYAFIRANLGEAGGTEVDTVGDGFLATFQSPLQAIRCVLRILRSSPRQVRMS